MVRAGERIRVTGVDPAKQSGLAVGDVGIIMSIDDTGEDIMNVKFPLLELHNLSPYNMVEAGITFEFLA